MSLRAHMRGNTNLGAQMSAHTDLRAYMSTHEIGSKDKQT